MTTTARSARRAERRLTLEEEALLEAAMRDVKPRRRRSKPPAPPPPAATAEAAPPRPAPSAPRRVPAVVPLPPLDPEGPLAGLDKGTAERLARGQLAIDGRLDLHGLHQAAAHRELEDFIAASAAGGRRLVLVITGKGGDGPGGRRGVLRDAAPRWLNEAPMRAKILAVRPARPRHGGDGALYVLLKRRR